jgi:hypothetical protein
MKRIDNTDTKQCSCCNKVLPVSQYWKKSQPRKDGSFGLRPRCKVCDTQYKLDIYHNKGGKDIQKLRSFKSLLKKYGITEEEYNNRRKLQNNSCEICGDHEDNQPHGRLHVDHCHTTGLFRGLLCNTCNTGLGMFKDNTTVLFKAIEYINENIIRHRDNTKPR